MLSSWGSFGMIKKLRFEDDKGNKWFGPHYQPIHLIRQYHGEHVALYFAWLGLYTRWLVTPMLLGICTMFGYLVWDQDNNRFAVVYSVFLSLWSTMFLGAWERTNNELKFQWGSEGFEDTEKPRPQFRGRFIRSDQVRDVSIFVRPVLTGIYLCHACSCQNIEDGNAPGQTGVEKLVHKAGKARVKRLGKLSLSWSTVTAMILLTGARPAEPV
jgi:hypothetical protein